MVRSNRPEASLSTLRIMRRRDSYNLESQPPLLAQNCQSREEALLPKLARTSLPGIYGEHEAAFSRTDQCPSRVRRVASALLLMHRRRSQYQPHVQDYGLVESPRRGARKWPHVFIGGLSLA